MSSRWIDRFGIDEGMRYNRDNCSSITYSTYSEWIEETVENIEKRIVSRVTRQWNKERLENARRIYTYNMRIVAMVINLLTTCFDSHRSCSDYRIVSPSSIARFPSIWRVEESIFVFFVFFFRLFVECVERYLRHTGWSGIIIIMGTLSTSYFSYDKSCV